MDFEQGEDAAIAQLCSRLIVEFRHRWPAGHVTSEVFAAHAAFEGARVRDFVPVLVERRARAALEAGSRVPKGTVVPLWEASDHR